MNQHANTSMHVHTHKYRDKKAQSTIALIELKICCVKPLRTANADKLGKQSSS